CSKFLKHRILFQFSTIGLRETTWTFLYIFIRFFYNKAPHLSLIFFCKMIYLSEQQRSEFPQMQRVGMPSTVWIGSFPNPSQAEDIPIEIISATEDIADRIYKNTVSMHPFPLSLDVIRNPEQDLQGLADDLNFFEANGDLSCCTEYMMARYSQADLDSQDALSSVSEGALSEEDSSTDVCNSPHSSASIDSQGYIDDFLIVSADEFSDRQNDFSSSEESAQQGEDAAWPIYMNSIDSVVNLSIRYTENKVEYSNDRPPRRTHSLASNGSVHNIRDMPFAEGIGQIFHSVSGNVENTPFSRKRCFSEMQHDECDESLQMPDCFVPSTCLVADSSYMSSSNLVATHATPLRTRKGFRKPILISNDLTKPLMEYLPETREWRVVWIENGEAKYKVFQCKKHGKLKAQSSAQLFFDDLVGSK
ncbi:AP2 domain transcription factor AP2VI-3, partial [Cardiosporidium cionae]